MQRFTRFNVFKLLFFYHNRVKNKGPGKRFLQFSILRTMKQWSHVNSAATIINSYTGDEPFASFIKKHFSIHRKYGSKDRKHISHLCYCYFRLGKSSPSLSIEERIIMGLFLCSAESNELLRVLRPDWNDKAGLSLEEKCLMLSRQNLDGNEFNARNSMLNVFPWKDQLSDGIEHERFAASFFIQPDLFLRLRPANEPVVKQKLREAGIEFKIIKDDCISLSNSAKLDEIVELDKEAVVQDYNSQCAAEFLILVQPGTFRKGVLYRVWDCCAASGGKSIIAKDILGDVDLTVSDIRESILVNLKKRFAKAGIGNYIVFVKDLAKHSFNALPSGTGEGFNLIICDAPCTGSGTWSRTPEQLYYFEKNKIDSYSSLQQQIVSNVIPHLKTGGHFLYITCSVFKKENEQVTEFIKRDFGFDLIRMEVLKGYDKKADTLFAALLQKPL